MGRQRKGVADLELRDEGLRGSHRPGAVGGHGRCRDQYGCGEQRKHDGSQVQECAVVMMLEVLAFRLVTNEVVNSLETMERQIEEFERYANFEIGSGDGKDGRPTGRGCVHEGIVQTCFQRFRKEQGLRGRVLVLRNEGPFELPIAARNKRTTTKDSRRVRRKATAKEKGTRMN